MSRSIRLIDVAPTMARVMGVKTPPIDGKPIEEVEGWRCNRVVLAIVDSLGYGLYKALEPDLPKMRSMAEEGLLLKAECVAPSTTPAIASILTGLVPKKHGISNTSQASESEIRSLLEWASSENVRSAVVMEKEGARTFEGFVRVVMGVSKSLSLWDFDLEILANSLTALKTDPGLLVAHFVGIDRVAHLGGGIDEIKKAACAIDGHLGDLTAAAREGTMMIICGDHPLHTGGLMGVFDSKHVALILWKKEATDEPRL
ncbi:MAG TPA: alkaline phosphatase family protein [Methanothrix sp.]|nr:alkaline phosphatase family protein [Methanothrix sp.]HPJ84521.1 alkaline phosphatase family protein [Methanothrix sp.]